MGNCLRAQHNKVVQVMKMDGKVLEYQAPIKVFQVLSEFTGHAISYHSVVLPAAGSSNHYLYPHADLLGGRLYYLVPVKVRAPNSPVKKKVRFSLPETEEQEPTEREAASVKEEKVPAATIEGFRIKLVITKAELKKMIDNGLVSMDGTSMTSIATNKLEEKNKEDDDQLYYSNDDDGLGSDEDDHTSGYLWKPSLVAIPEGNQTTLVHS